MGRNGSDKRDLFDSILASGIEHQPAAKLLTFSAAFSAFRVASAGSIIGGGADKTSTVGLRGPLNRVAPLKRRKERGKEAGVFAYDLFAYASQPRSRDGNLSRAAAYLRRRKTDKLDGHRRRRVERLTGN